MPAPPPLTPKDRLTYQVLAVVAVVVLGLGIYFPKSTYTYAMLGGGGGLLGMSLIRLFYRPDK